MQARSFAGKPARSPGRVIKITQIWCAFCLLLLCPGLARAQSWQTKTTTVNGTTFFPSLPILLTDGTVMCQDSQTSDWWKLTPDVFGSYVNGTWTQIASMPAGYGPLYYASAVLADGRVVVLGGEYNLGSGTATDTNLGAIYDPVADTWTPLAGPPGWSSIGDASCAVLPDGRFLLANLFGTNGAILDPTTLTWTARSFTGKADANSEEGWTLLSDGTIVTTDTQNGTHAERYDPTTDTWRSAGSTGVSLVAGQEVGPQVLRPDGTVVFFGASGHNALYHPDTNTWSTVPDFPAGLDIADGPACLLPNGNVFCVASPGLYNAGAQFFEYNGTSLISEPATKFNAPDISSYFCNMLMLPTGQVLFSYTYGEVEFYNSVGSPAAAWKPTITDCPTAVVPGTSYTISGTQFNGLSQASVYGDDASNATNYPLVRVTNHTTGHVTYFRTHNHSTMGVATGSAIVSTHFDVPATAELGDADLVVVTNGIASDPFTITVSLTSVTLTDLSLTPNSVTGGHSAIGTITLSDSAPAGGAVVALTSDNGTVASVPATVTVPAGSNTVNFTVSTTPVAFDTIVGLSATLNGVTQSASLTVFAPAALSVSVSPTSVKGGQSATGTVTLTGSAPAGGSVVSLSSSNTSAASVPGSVTIAAGASTATFTTTTSVVGVSTPVTLSAILGTTATTTLTVKPPSVTNLSVAPTSVKGGQNATGTVTISDPAPTGGIAVTLSSSNSALAAGPASTTVAAGATTANFTVTTHGVATSTTVNLTATLGTSSSSGPLTVTPPDLTSLAVSPGSVKGGLTSTGTVTLSDPAGTGGIVVNLSSNKTAASVPTTVTVPSGAKTATFTVSTSGVSTDTSATITGTFNSQNQTATLTVQAPLLTSFALHPTTVRSLQTSTATLTLDGPAPTGGISVNLFSANSSVATVPVSVLVPAGATHVDATVNTYPVAVDTRVLLAATLGTSNQSVNLTVQPHLPFDFNNDGQNDLIFQNLTTNLIVIWYTNALSVIGGDVVNYTPPSGWQVVGCGDINHDGNPDLFLQNQTTGQINVWYMQGTVVTGGEALSQQPAAGYKVVGIGDFNADGKPDILFQNPSNGQLAIWYLNGAAVTGGVAIPQTPSAGYNVVGVGDFNSDGKPDIVFQNQSNNQVVVWYMNGSLFAGGGAIAYVPPFGWQVLGVEDINGDGKPDLVFQNQTTNQVLVWFMDGLNIPGGGNMSQSPDAGYKLRGPH